MTWNDPAPTMTTQFFGFGNGRFGHPEQDRAISLREGAILQIFPPPDYEFTRPEEQVCQKSIGRLIGNAVPEPGQLVEVRRRQWVVTDVSSGALSPTSNGDQHLVGLSSLDEDSMGEEIQVTWQMEAGVQILEKAGLPSITGWDSPGPLRPAAAAAPAPAGSPRPRAVPPAPGACGASSRTTARQPDTADWRTPGRCAKVNLGRIFGHRSLTWFSLHFQGYDCSEILPTSPRPITKRSTRSWGRVTAGDYSPAVPTDPDVRVDASGSSV